MECQRCYREVAGAEVTIEYPLTIEIVAQLVESTPDRDWFQCQACDKIICFQCGRHPASGFCDECITRFNLTAELVEYGLIQEDAYGETTIH